MAKKNLKRGLALGALMAFVITGSAMAAETPFYVDGTINPELQTYNNLEINSAGELMNGSGRYKDIALDDGAQAIFTGAYTKIIIDNQITTNETAAIQLFNGSVATFSADETIISSKSVGGSGHWGFSLLANGTNGNKIIFNGKNVSISAYQDDYTAQTLTAKQGSSIDFNNTGDVTIKAESPTSVTAVDMPGKITFNNTGDVNIIASIIPNNVTGDINNIGIQGWEEFDGSAALTVTNKVDNFNISLTGQGVDYNGTSYSSGTAAILAEDGMDVTIDSNKFNIKIEISADTAIDTPTGHTSEEAHGLKLDGDAILIASENTVTNINVNEGIGTAYAVHSGKTSDIKLLGDTTIVANGKKASYALLANNYFWDGNQGEAGSITVGSAGKNVYLTGDVVADGGTINVNGASVELTGNIETLNSGETTIKGDAVNFTGKALTDAGTTNINFGSGTWNLSGASSVTSATFGAGSSLVIDGTKFTGAEYAITGKVSMDPTANLVINNSAPDTNYKVVKGENNISDANLSYDRTALVAVEKTDGVYEVEFKSLANATDAELSAAQDKAITANGGSALVAPSIISGAMSPSASAESKALASAITQMSGTAEQKAAIINDIAQIGEKAGNTTNAVNLVNNVTGITNQRMSFTNINTAPQGGHGKVERKYKSGAGIWAQYMHGKDKVDDLPGAGGTTSSYESQYNGAVIGYDFKEVGKTKTGIAFNYGEGDSHSKDAAVKTNNDFDFWGIGLYHSIMNEDTNLIFDINYNKTDADVTQVVPGYGKITVNPNTTAISAGVRAEKLIQNGPVQIVPYIGARFLSIDTDEYTSSTGTKFSPDRQNIWLVPVGVSLRQENNYENGWKVTPKADFSYIWALGDTDSNMNVATGVKVDNLAYTVMDDGSFLGTLGIEAEKGDWTYGLSYSYQKGEYQRSDKWFVDVRYSF